MNRFRHASLSSLLGLLLLTGCSTSLEQRAAQPLLAVAQQRFDAVAQRIQTYALPDTHKALLLQHARAVEADTRYQGISLLDGLGFSFMEKRHPDTLFWHGKPPSQGGAPPTLLELGLVRLPASAWRQQVALTRPFLRTLQADDCRVITSDLITAGDWMRMELRALSAMSTTELDQALQLTRDAMLAAIRQSPAVARPDTAGLERARAQFARLVADELQRHPERYPMAGYDEHAMGRAISSMFCNPELDMVGKLLTLPEPEGNQLLLELLLEAVQP